jgi:hypothetical protein
MGGKHGSRFYVCADVDEVSFWQTYISVRCHGLMRQKEVGGYHGPEGMFASISLTR